MLKWFCEKSSTKEQSLWITSILTQWRTYVCPAAIFLGRTWHDSSAASPRAFPSHTTQTPHGLLRDFIPKGMSMERFSDEDILNMADTLNQRPRRVLGYHTPSELLMHSSMKFMLLSVFLDYSCSNSTCNLPTRVHGYIGSIYPLVC